jgi:hypothetical protein
MKKQRRLMIAADVYRQAAATAPAAGSRSTATPSLSAGQDQQSAGLLHATARIITNRHNTG